jgi:hypothetical protein
MSRGSPSLRVFPITAAVALLVFVWAGCAPKVPVVAPAQPAAAAPVAETPPEASPKSPSASAPETAASSASATSEKPEDSLPTAPPDSSLKFPVQKDLTTAIHLYITDNQKLPPNFDALVKGRYVKAMPKPPAGKRFALDRNRTQVVIID